MTPQSAKSKGRNLQKEIVKLFIKKFPELDGEIFWRSMGASGSDVYFSRDANIKMPYAIEAKCQESLNIWSALEQAQTHVDAYSKIPLLIFKRNHTPLYACLPFTDFLELIKDR